MHLLEGKQEASLPRLPRHGRLFRQWLEVLLAGYHSRPCPRHHVPLLQRRDAPHVAAALRVDCRRYNCEACAPRRKSLWLIHLALLFERHGGPLFVWEGEPGQPWELATRQLRRHRADYCALRTSAGPLVAIATVQPVGAEQISPALATERVAQALRDLARVRLPISTSRSWKLDEQVGSGRYRRKGAAPRGCFQEVVDHLREHQLDPAVRESAYGQRTDWMFPGTWCPEQVEWLFDSLGSVRRQTQANPEEK
jgi:hypothetical protein